MGQTSHMPEPVPEWVGFNDLVARMKAGDRDALGRALELVRPYMKNVLRGFADTLRPAQSTIDLVQDAELRIMEKVSTFQGGATDEQSFKKFKSWVARLAKNHGINKNRDGKRPKRSPGRPIRRLDAVLGPGRNGTPCKAEPIAPDERPSEIARKKESIERVIEEIQTLPELERRVLTLRAHEGLTSAEVARLLHLKPDEVRRIFARATRTLGERLRDIA